MSALEASVIVVLAVLPWYWLVQRELSKLEDRDYLRAHGVVIVSETALQAHSAPIGQRLGPRELFLDPGLVYVTV